MESVDGSDDIASSVNVSSTFFKRASSSATLRCINSSNDVFVPFGSSSLSTSGLENYILARVDRGCTCIGIAVFWKATPSVFLLGAVPIVGVHFQLETQNSTTTLRRRCTCHV